MLRESVQKRGKIIDQDDISFTNLLRTKVVVSSDLRSRN